MVEIQSHLTIIIIKLNNHHHLQVRFTRDRFAAAAVILLCPKNSLSSHLKRKAKQYSQTRFVHEI
ncbi:hypothetical protein DERP_006255 [Dermatophagoides pteronyssinus]|uniref:Uncharacterized protein n=1 Tax=Dermatophagoides pteronyssinus TaxID=6956 RepID=A0ABQ8IY09_DERPT|nr:hypothetical protein DERP_006255 [Dermatophagoides pteronyssinus]